MIEAAVYSLLSGSSPVSTLVGARIYPVTAPQVPTFPLITYSKISSTGQDLHHNGTTGAARSVFQITAYATTPAAAKAIAAAVRGALHGYSGTVSGETIFLGQVVNEVDLFDPDAALYAAPVDVLLVHRN